VKQIVSHLIEEKGIVEGITISGGEPFQQPKGLLFLIQNIRALTCFSVIIFSGFYKDEIMKIPQGPEILSLTDLLIAGRYVSRLHLAKGLRGSTNQIIHLLSERFSLPDIDSLPDSEIRIDSEGRITMSGIDPPV
jgi:anaerobic ribonucleoside-triphosphate reductase activating protein